MNLSSFSSFRFIPVICLLVGLTAFPTTVMALGMSPPTIEIESILRNTSQVRSVGIYRAVDDIGDIYIHVEPGGQYGNFIVSGEDDIVMLKGQDSLQYEFEVNPGDAANGTYEAILRFLKKAPVSKFEGSGTSIITGVGAQILITVGGDESLSYELISLFANPTELDKPMEVEYTVSNTGNVDWAIEKIVFAFTNPTDGSVVETVEVDGTELEVVKAGKPNQKFPLIINPSLPLGEYGLEATFFSNGLEVSQLEIQSTVSILAEGTLAQDGELAGLSTNKETYAVGDKVKIDAVFKNTGHIAVDALMVASVYRGDDVIDLIRSKSFSVLTGSEVVFSEFFDPAGVEGEYAIEAYVEYGNKRTSSERIEFSVSSQAVPTESLAAVVQTGSFLNSYIGIGILVLLLSLLAVLYKKRKSHQKAGDTTPPAAPPTPPTPPAAPPTPPAAPPTPPAAPLA